MAAVRRLMTMVIELLDNTVECLQYCGRILAIKHIRLSEVADDPAHPL